MSPRTERTWLEEPQNRDGEELYRLLVERAKEYAIFIIDPKGAIATWNHGAERIFGFDEDEAVGAERNARGTGVDAERAFTHPDTGSGLAAIRKRVRNQSGAPMRTVKLSPEPPRPHSRYTSLSCTLPRRIQHPSNSARSSRRKQ